MTEFRAPRLPNEIYLRIAKHLAASSEDRELLRLRLISQIFTQGVDDRFLDVHYANRVCPATTQGLRNLGFMFQDSTLAPFIKTLTIDANSAMGLTSIPGYLDSIQNMLQTRVDATNRIALIVPLNGSLDQLQATALCRSFDLIREWATNNSNNPIQRFEFDMDVPLIRNNINHHLFSKSASLFNILLRAQGPDHLDLILRPHDRTAMAMTIRYTKENRRLECIAPLAADQQKGPQSLLFLLLFREHVAELDLRNCYVHFLWLKQFIRFNRTTLRSVVLENIRIAYLRDGLPGLKAVLFECSGLQYVRLRKLHDEVSSNAIFEKEIEICEGGAPGRIRDILKTTDFTLSAPPPGPAGH